jgi:hypothetical protein
VMTRSQQTDEQSRLQTDLNQANIKLAQIKLDELTTQKDTLTRRIADYESQMATTKNLLTYSKDSIDTTSAILEEAQKQEVFITDLTSPGTTTEVLDGNTCEILTLNIRVKGSIQHIADFIFGISKTFPTSVIKSVELDIQPPSAETEVPTLNEIDEPTPEVTPEKAPVKDTSVSINLVIYNYKGK